MPSCRRSLYSLSLPSTPREGCLLAPARINLVGRVLPPRQRQRLSVPFGLARPAPPRETTSMDPLKNSSVIGRLLEDISWEGQNVRAYRKGGRGRENVLTAEVLWPLSCLPRDAFLAEVLRHAHGAEANRLSAAAEAEEADVMLLPDEIELGPERVVVQPDATSSAPARMCSSRLSGYAHHRSKRINSLESWSRWCLRQGRARHYCCSSSKTHRRFQSPGSDDCLYTTR